MRKKNRDAGIGALGALLIPLYFFYRYGGFEVGLSPTHPSFIFFVSFLAILITAIALILVGTFAEEKYY